MIKEDYVSFETAKLLKEKGFDEICFNVYTGTNNNYYPPFINHEFTLKEETDYFTIPTLQMAMKWLREVHKLYMYTAFAGMEEVWFSRIYDKNKHLKDLDNFKTYEEACEAGIKYCLENLI